MKKVYKKPQSFTVTLKDYLMDVITPGTPTDDFAKEQKVEVIEEETLPVGKNIWEDDEE